MYSPQFQSGVLGVKSLQKYRIKLEKYTNADFHKSNYFD